MSEFWDAMKVANGAAIEILGEPVVIGGVPAAAVVDDFSAELDVGAGGKRSVIKATLLVGAETVLADGMPVQLRGCAGKVGLMERYGPDGHWKVTVGPANRWGGEVPGL